MSEAVAPKPRAGRTVQGRRRLRASLAVAALDLFAAHGFENTTVDQIAEAANVGRRTFFRYFRSKDDVLFPDHDERLAEVTRVLDTSAGVSDPLAAVERAAELVLEMYLAEPEVSLKRFEVTRHVASLRDKEIVTIDRYQRVFARYLQGRYAEQPNGALRASVTAAAVVAAHNHVLREWLKSGGALDARGLLRDALASMRTSMAGLSSSPEAEHRVVVGVVRTASSAEAVLERLTHALDDLSS